jgi:serine/threonine-protein kinase
VPGYEIVRKIGESGQGIVYLARPHAGGDPVAIKVIVPRSAMSERAIDVFKREMEVHGKLRHPNIVRFIAQDFAGGQFFFVMEYVDGPDLRVYQARAGGRLAPREAVALMAQVFDALEYAHAQGFVHRDVKPSNVLVAAGAVAKLVDFGLARSYDDVDSASGLTFEGEAKGTLPFMPPDQIIDCRRAKPAADIYSAGATLYHLLTDAYVHDFERKGGKGKDPFLMILEDPVVPLRQRVAALPAALAAAIEKCLEKKPERRYASAAEAKAAIVKAAGP